MNEALTSPGFTRFKKRALELAKTTGHPTTQEYLSLAHEAVELKKRHPEIREQLAYFMVAAGGITAPVSKTDERLNEIADLFAFLEIPDAHVYTGDGLSVQDKWERIADLLEHCA